MRLADKNGAKFGPNNYELILLTRPGLKLNGSILIQFNYGLIEKIIRFDYGLIEDSAQAFRVYIYLLYSY